MIGKEAFLDDIARSLTRVGLGFCIAVVLGIGICLMSALPPLRAAVLPLLELTRPIPPIAWIPLMMVMFGVGEGAAIAIVAMAAFFPITVTLIASAEAIDTDMLRTVRSLGAGRLAQIRHVYGPAMLPGLFVGARLGLGIGWFSVVAAEMVGTFGGLGYGVQVTTLNLDMERFFVYLFAIGLCGFCLNAMLLGAKHRICPWQE
jgi:ABC-type nitrate/sulfonate/bicarbonate transport system permease component